jgi:YidC/Oxa1 family membrane protein insertase
MLDKKTLPLIILLVVLIVFYFQIMERLGLYSPAKKTPPSEPQPTQIDSGTQKLAEQKGLDTFAEHIREAPPPIHAQQVQTSIDSVSADTVIVTTNKFVVTLTSFGGGPVSLLLNDYTYRDKRPIQMLPDAELATPEATFAGGTFSTSHVNFRCRLQPGTYDATKQPLELVYTFGTPQQGQIVKSFRFYPDGYHFDLALEVTNPGQLGFERQYYLNWNNALGVTEPQPETDYNAMEAVAMMGGSRRKLNDFQNDRLNQSETGYTTWAGVRSKYFAAVLIPRNRTADGVIAMGEKRKVSTPSGRIEERSITVGIDMPFASVSSFADTFTVFVGPLDYTLMSKYHVDLEDMLGIGTSFLGWIIKPFALAVIWLLPRMYSVISNYGVVIILFALLVKIVTLPLSLKSFKSMNAMRELQPKIEELKKKHKKNPQALNAEMMKLYKAHGVNPMSGCLPMLLQMPLFFALFSVFRATILLRDAPFVWFITDLSRGATSYTDPYMILVIIMIATQFISQRFTMATTTQQNKMLMYIFPLFMGFLLYKFPAGLVLYWTCFSVFSLLDYFVFRRRKAAEVKVA